MHDINCLINTVSAIYAPYIFCHFKNAINVSIVRCAAKQKIAREKDLKDE